MIPTQPVLIDFQQRDGRGLLLVSGRLDVQTVNDAWRRIVSAVSASDPQELTVDLSGVTYCDGAGLGLCAAVRRRVCAAGKQVAFVGSSPELQRLLDMSMLADPQAKELDAAPRPSLLVDVGRATWDVLVDVGQIVAFTGQLAAALAWAVAHPRKVRWRDAAHLAQKAGASAVPVVSLLGLLVGVILAYQCAAPLRRYGAEAMIPAIVAIAVVRELGPLITAILLAGRSGSAFAAEIGTMKVTEELAALKTMALEPVHFLVVPRVLAAMAVTPLLALYNIILGLVGGCLIMMALGYPFQYFANAMTASVSYVDLLGVMFKTLVFAAIVAGVGCLRGVQTRSGPGAVGDSTTRAVVAGIVLTIAADAVLGVVYYYLGI